MSTKTVDKCDSCGAVGGPLNTAEHCRDCEMRHHETDLWAEQAIRDTLGAAAAAALDHLAGEDVRRIVSEAVTEREAARERSGLSPRPLVAEINWRLGLVRGANIAANEETALGEHPSQREVSEATIMAIDLRDELAGGDA